MSYIYDRCPNCMNPYDGTGNPCPYCGQDVTGYIPPKNCLPPFTILQNKYMIGRVLGQGGFGITYVGYDMNLATYVAIKEYYPESISVRGLGDNPIMVTAQSGKDEIYNKNLNRFVEEARNLSRFYSLPGIVSVRNFFYDNGTAYIVMDYVAGDNLKKYLADNGGRLDEGTVLALMKPVLESLYEIHKQGLIHRDISPDNIMFDIDGTIKLIDFGAVRGSSAEMDMTYTVMLKHGYAPQEQYYTKGNQGPWTDIYSLCATMYKMLTGAVPPNCIERMSEDSYIPPSQCGVILSPQVEAALTKGLSVNISDRYQNIGELIKDLYGKDYTFMGDGQIGVTNAVESVESTAFGADISKKAPNGKKRIAIMAGALAAVLALVVCIGVIINKKKPDDSSATTTTENTTEASTTQTESTEVTTEEKVADYAGSWNDFKFMIDGQEYKLPMTYDEWVGNGWKTDYNNCSIEPGQLREIIYYNERMACGVVCTNFADETKSLEESYIIGFQFYSDVHRVEAESVITLPGDIVMNTMDDSKSVDAAYAKSVYGEPTDFSENEMLQQYRYFDDDANMLLLRFWAGEGLCRISYISYMPPSGVEFPSCQQVDTVPLNEAYVVPGPTTDRWDDVLSVDGAMYKIHCPVSEFIDNGWTLDFDLEILEPGLMSMGTLTKGNSSMTVTLANYTVYDLKPEQLCVQDIALYSDTFTDMDVVFPGGVKMGMSMSAAENLYADCSNRTQDSEYGDKEFVSHISVPDGQIVVTYTVELGDDNVYYITGMKYSHSQISRDSDDDNTDYIDGRMVQ